MVQTCRSLIPRGNRETVCVWKSWSRSLERCSRRPLHGSKTRCVDDGVLAAENRIPRARLPSRLRLWDPEQRALAHFSRAEERTADQFHLNLAAMYTLVNSGEVYAVQPDRVPGSGPLSATFRY